MTLLCTNHPIYFIFLSQVKPIYY